MQTLKAVSLGICFVTTLLSWSFSCSIKVHTHFRNNPPLHARGASVLSFNGLLLQGKVYETFLNLKAPPKAFNFYLFPQTQWPAVYAKVTRHRRQKKQKKKVFNSFQPFSTSCNYKVIVLSQYQISHTSPTPNTRKTPIPKMWSFQRGMQECKNTFWAAVGWPERRSVTVFWNGGGGLLAFCAACACLVLESANTHVLHHEENNHTTDEGRHWSHRHRWGCRFELLRLAESDRFFLLV